MVVRMNEYVKKRLAGPGEMGRTESVELSIDAVYRQGGHAVVGSEGVLHQDRTELPAHPKEHFEKRGESDANTLLSEAGVGRADDREFYRLSSDEIYYVEFEEEVDVPEGKVGLIAPQETLLWAGVMLHASLMGSEESVAEALIGVEEDSVLLQSSSSIAELVTLHPA
jgi:deoxycytidine triphosphate deaminase